MSDGRSSVSTTHFFFCNGTFFGSAMSNVMVYHIPNNNQQILEERRMSKNKSTDNDEHFRVVRCKSEYVQSNVSVQQITSVEGNEVNMLMLRRKDDKWTRIINCCYNANKTPLEKHVTYKFEWDLDRVAKEYDRNAEISFKYMETDRYEQHLTYLGGYQIGQSITVNMETARTVEPYIAGAHMKEEMEIDFHVPMVNGTIRDGFSPTQTDNKHLKRIMEQEIMRIVAEHRESTKTTTKDTEDDEKGNCAYCNDNPCVWVTNAGDMKVFDESEHNLVTVDDVPVASLHRKAIYRQMALTIAGGPTGKGVCIELPICVVDGVRNMFPDDDKKYMGHKDN